MQTIEWSQLDKPRFFIFGTCYFFTVRLILYPYSLLKTRFQLADTHQSTFSSFKNIIKISGFKSLYRGFAITASGAIPSQIIYLTVYEKTREATGINLIAGACASISSQLITVPVDIISQLQMISKNKVSVVSIIQNVINTQGIRGLFRGFNASILTYAPSSGIWWTCYHFFRSMVGGLKPEWSYDQELAVSALCGAASGCCSAVATCPLDVIKTRMQTVSLNDGMWSVTRELFKKQGISGFYRGLFPRMAYVSQVSMAMVVSYEIVKKLSVKQV